MQPTLNETLTYVSQLAALNESLVTPEQMPSPSVFNAFAWGLVEELLEYDVAQGKLNKCKEAGDVLAYAVLLLLCVASVEDVAEALTHFASPKFSRLDYFSNLKRVNREGAPFKWSLALSAWVRVYTEAQEVHSLSFGDKKLTNEFGEEETIPGIASTNLSKLQDRAARKVMFSGSGDNR